MSATMRTHVFSGDPLRSRIPKTDDSFASNSALETLRTLLSETTDLPSIPSYKVIPFLKCRPLAYTATPTGDSPPIWYLGWLGLLECRELLAKSEVLLSDQTLVYLGSRQEEGIIYWAMDMTPYDSISSALSSRNYSFVELRTLMVATDWADDRAMGELAIAGHAKALLEWHQTSRFCGKCGASTIPIESGKRRECSNGLCKRRIYPRVDPVVIMLVIDRENDRALLGRQSRFVPRMWSCLAGFIEPGESLEEAVRRETWEESGVEVGEVVYHSSQPWPVGSNGIPCQLMIAFFAYAKSFEVNVDKKELEDARWHGREDVKKALTITEYKKAQRTAAAKVDRMCKGVENKHSHSLDFNVESGELATMFIPGPFAIAHHLISAWVHHTSDGQMPFSHLSSSNL